MKKNYLISPFNGQTIISMVEFPVFFQPIKLKYVRWMHQLFEHGMMYSFNLN